MTDESVTVAPVTDSYIRSNNIFMFWPDRSDGGFNQAVCELDPFIHILAKCIYNVCRIVLMYDPVNFVTPT